MGQGLETVVEPSRGLRFLQGVDEVHQGSVVDSPPALGRRDRQADGQVCFAHPGRTHDTMLTLRPPLESTTPFTP